jgi:hypothetical protein
MRAKIHTWVFLAFTAVAGAALSGCVVDNRTNPPSGSCLDQRYAHVTWNLAKDVNNVQLTCEQANADLVLLYFGGSAPYQFACTDYEGFTSTGLTPGNYAVSMQLLSPTNVVLSDTAVNGTASVPIYSCAPSEIPTVTFGVQ